MQFEATEEFLANNRGVSSQPRRSAKAGTHYSGGRPFKVSAQMDGPLRGAMTMLVCLIPYKNTQSNATHWSPPRKNCFERQNRRRAALRQKSRIFGRQRDSAPVGRAGHEDRAAAVNSNPRSEDDTASHHGPADASTSLPPPSQLTSPKPCCDRLPDQKEPIAKTRTGPRGQTPIRPQNSKARPAGTQAPEAGTTGFPGHRRQMNQRSRMTSEDRPAESPGRVALPVAAADLPRNRIESPI